MSFPEEHRRDIEAMPPVLRALLKAELEMGNEIVEVGHSFPAPPAGAYFKLARRVMSRPRATGGGLEFYDRNTSIYSGEFTDAKRFFFILEPPLPLEPPLDQAPCPQPPSVGSKGCDESPPPPHANVQPQASTVSGAQMPAGHDTPLRRFEKSRIINYEKWHDGVGYDLDALREMSLAERQIIETKLIQEGLYGWRDVEALAELNSPRAQQALRAAMNHSKAEVRLAITRYAPELISRAQRTTTLVRSLHAAEFFGGLSEALDQVEEFHPPEVITALFEGTLHREGEVAVHFAAMLMFLHGKADEPFDMDQRPFFLRFNTSDRSEREAAFRELCAKIKIDSTPFLRQ
jgi:hypothetical protein